jgi:tetratricopeptide (TPR) repeat protein
MSELKSDKLTLAENLMYDGQLEEALNVVIDFENEKGISPKEKLSTCILKGRIYAYRYQYVEASKAGDIAYNMSQKQNKVKESIDSLILKGYSFMKAEFDKALDFVLEADKLINSNTSSNPLDISQQQAELLKVKAEVYNIRGEYDKALEIALSCLEFIEQGGEKLTISRILIVICQNYFMIGEPDKSLEFAVKGLEMAKELEDKDGIAVSLTLIGGGDLMKGKFDQGIKNLKHGYSLKIVNFTRLRAINLMGSLYRERGLLDEALSYYEEANKLAEENDYILYLIWNMTEIGAIYRMKGDYEKALEHLKTSLKLSEEKKFPVPIIVSLTHLALLNIDKNSRGLAQKYVNQLKEYTEKIESKMLDQSYTFAKALLLKTSGLSRSRVRAETLLRQIIEDQVYSIRTYILSLVFLCDYLLEELNTSNDSEVLNEINPLITRLLELAEKQNSYSWLAETKLLQAKLALIRLRMEDAQKLMTEAQKIADYYGLDLLAMTISSEHDILLEKLESWNLLKEQNAPMSERFDLASIDGVINRLEGSNSVNPPVLVNEESIHLLIMDKSGFSYFDYQFIENWDFSDLFSSFMSAFNTFSSEIFSQSIDRIKIGENTILITPIEPFLVCYVIKGQSYPALQKLTRFSEVIKEKTEIWNSLEKCVITSEVLTLGTLPSLGLVINEIFN